MALALARRRGKNSFISSGRRKGERGKERAVRPGSPVPPSACRLRPIREDHLLVHRFSARLGLAALLGGALVLGGDAAQARPGHGGGGHGGGGHGGGFHAGGFHAGGFSPGF